MSGFQNINGKMTIEKDPNAILNYTWDWSDWLVDLDPDGAIAEHQILLANSPSAVVLSSGVFGPKITAIIAGGVVGEKIAATCRMTTINGLVDDFTLYLKVKEH